MTSRVSCSFAFQIWSQYKLSLITLYKCNPQLISITDEHPNIRHFNTSLPALMYLTWRNFIPTDWSAALRKIMNENLNTAINTVLNLPIKATPMRICEEMYEQLHREITGKCAITNFMHIWWLLYHQFMTRACTKWWGKFNISLALNSASFPPNFPTPKEKTQAATPRLLVG